MQSSTVLAELRTLAQRQVGTLIAKVFEQADNALFDMSQSITTSNDQLDFLAAMRDLRKQRRVVEESMNRAIAEWFSEVQSAPEPEVQDPLEIDASSLSLVDTDALEEQLTAERIATAVEKRSLEGLGLFALGLGKLVDAPAFSVSKTPMAPIRVAETFSQLLKNVLAAPKPRLVVQKLFERVMVTDYSASLGAMNRLIAARGIQVRLPEPALRRARDIAAKARGEGGDTAGGPADGTSRTKVDAGRADADRADSESHASHGGWRRPNGGFKLADGNEVPDAVFSAMLDVFATYLKGQRDPNGQRDGAPCLSQEAALETLNAMQADPPQSLLVVAIDPNTSVALPLKRELLGAAIAAGRAEAGARIQLADEQALSLVGMLFDTVLDQGDFEPEIRERFVRLSIPYAKVALLDRRMFAHKSHPARRLLNAIAEACEGNHAESRSDRELLDSTITVIDRLLAEWKDDAEVFTALEREFNGIVDQHRRRISLTEKRTAEAHKGRERLEEARAAAALELSSLLGGRSAPKPIANFLRHEWMHHLTMTYLRDGEDSDAYRKATSAGVTLWLSLLACERGGDAPAGITQLLLPALTASGQGADEARVLGEEIIRVLRSVRPREVTVAPEHVRGVPDPEPAQFESVPAHEVVAIVESRPAEGDVELDVDTREFRADDLERIRALEVGAWLDLTDASGTRQAAKLSWISPISRKMLFVNRRGARLCALAAEEMAALMREGKLSIREVDTAFERAMTQMIGTLKSNAVAPMAHSHAIH